jgi:hypothetical protein
LSQVLGQEVVLELDEGTDVVAAQGVVQVEMLLNFFFFIADAAAKYSRVFVLAEHLRPSLTFISEDLKGLPTRLGSCP